MWPRRAVGSHCARKSPRSNSPAAGFAAYAHIGIGIGARGLQIDFEIELRFAIRSADESGVAIFQQFDEFGIGGMDAHGDAAYFNYDVVAGFSGNQLLHRATRSGRAVKIACSRTSTRAAIEERRATAASILAPIPNFRRGRLAPAPRSIDTTVPSNSSARKGSSAASNESPRVVIVAVGFSPASARGPITRCATNLPLRSATAISPRSIFSAARRSTTNTSPGQTAGIMLIPVTRTRTRPNVRTTSPANSQPSAFAVCSAELMNACD